jgi:hypothetical protein
MLPNVVFDVPKSSPQADIAAPEKERSSTGFRDGDPAFSDLCLRMKLLRQKVLERGYQVSLTWPRSP